MWPHPAPRRDVETYRQAVARAKREYLTELLDYCDGDVQKAARLGGVNRSLIYKLVPQVVASTKPKKAIAATRPKKVIQLFGHPLAYREVDLSQAPLAQRFGR